MRNAYLRPTVQREIDLRVEKVIRGLGHPEPPLRLEDVRGLLKLDRQYYSSSSGGLLRETVSRLMVAGKQILRRPSLLLDAIRAAELKSLYVPDRKMILLDEVVPAIKQRWNETHEAIHSILDWHGGVLLGDDLLTLSLSCHERIEAEANFGAGRLLFLQDRFEMMANDSKPTFSLVQSVSKVFGNSMTSTLWRFVELLDLPAVGVVSQHPKYKDNTFNADDPCRYFIRSRPFLARFSVVDELDAFKLIRDSCSFRRYGPVANDEIVLTDDHGEKHLFSLESFCNHHELLTLLVYVKPYGAKVIVPSLAAIG